MISKILVLVILCFSVDSSAADEQSARQMNFNNINVNVSFKNKEVILDATFTVNANIDQVWDVLIDFDHAAQFISNLQESKILEAKDNVFKVEQKGLAKYGLLSFKFESIREIHLNPKFEIQTHLLSGTMRKFDGTMKLKSEGEVTEIVYHSESIPGVWIPPLLGKHFIEHETQEQFSEIMQEIMRRKDSVKPS